MTQSERRTSRLSASFQSRAAPTLLLLLLLVLTLSTALVDRCQGAANVTMKDIRIFRQFNWLLPPQVFFACDGQYENRTELPFVRSTDESFTFTGKEPWQPIFALADHECVTCGVYERGWFENVPFGRWTVCTHNFTMVDNYEGRLSLAINGTVAVNITCGGCASEDFDWHVKHSNDTLALPNDGLTISLWVLGAAGILCILSLFLVFFFICVIAYLAERTHHGHSEEKGELLKGYKYERHHAHLLDGEDEEEGNESSADARVVILDDSSSEEDGRSERRDSGDSQKVGESDEVAVMEDDGSEAEVLAEIKRVLHDNQRRVRDILKISDILRDHPDQFL